MFRAQTGKNKETVSVMEDYEKLLDRAMSKIKKTGNTERFEMPQIDSIIQGNQTIIRNLNHIAASLRREQKHVLKYLARETASPVHGDGQRGIFQARIPRKVLQGKLENYVKEYVICKECKRPDTKLIKEGGIMILRCEACGARASVKAIK